MIVTKLTGGMGNQLFQYAVGRALSLKHNTPLFLDITALRFWNERQGTKREYALGAFHITSGIIDTRLKRLLQVSLRNLAYVHKKNSDRFDQGALKAPKNTYLNGYWLSYKYFESIRDTLKKDLQLKDPLSLPAQEVERAIVESESVAIHVRRGDNITNPKSAAFHGSPAMKDYENRIQFFEHKLSNPHFFIFSDDPAWCRENIKSKHPTVYVSGDTSYPHEDFHLMRSCKHQAVANSTLSWWSAWLNENPNKIVLKPRFFTLGKFDTADLYPEDWIAL